MPVAPPAGLLPRKSSPGARLRVAVIAATTQHRILGLCDDRLLFCRGLRAQLRPQTLVPSPKMARPSVWVASDPAHLAVVA
jgi:hypothetical protein